MITIPSLAEVLDLTKTKALVWKKIYDNRWTWNYYYRSYVRWQEYEARCENFQLRFQVRLVGKKRTTVKKSPELIIQTEDPSFKAIYGNSRKLRMLANLLSKTSW